jgi:DNA-binding NarL/FixJ family response regulator
VDDYHTVLWGLAKLIKGESPRMRLVGTASNLSQALFSIKHHHPDVVLLDDDLEDGDVMDILPQLVALGHHRIIILTSEQYSLEFTKQVIVLGASGILSKDSPAEQLLSAIECVHREGSWFGK